MLHINGVALPSPDTYEVTISDLDASASRSGNGTLFRDRIAVKRTINVGWAVLSTSELSLILQSVSPVFVSVMYFDPETGGAASGTFYASDRTQAVAQKQSDGSYKWSGVSFSLVER